MLRAHAIALAMLLRFLPPHPPPEKSRGRRLSPEQAADTRPTEGELVLPREGVVSRLASQYYYPKLVILQSRAHVWVTFTVLHARSLTFEEFPSVSKPLSGRLR